MARQLVESLAAEDFEPEKYHDQYREQVLDLIERKESGEEIVAEPQTEAPAKVLDLVAALEASIAKAKTAKDRHPSGAAAAREAGAPRRDEGDGQEAPKRAKAAAKKRSAERHDASATTRASGADAPASDAQLGDADASCSASSQPQPAHTGDAVAAGREARRRPRRRPLTRRARCVGSSAMARAVTAAS